MKEKKDNVDMPLIAKLYHDAIKQAIEIKQIKARDYNSGEIERENYYLRGDWTLIDEIWKKMLRIISIETSGKNVTCEKLEDTLLDMINYCADFHAYLKIKELRKNDKKKK